MVVRRPQLECDGQLNRVEAPLKSYVDGSNRGDNHLLALHSLLQAMAQLPALASHRSNTEDADVICELFTVFSPRESPFTLEQQLNSLEVGKCTG